MADEIKPDTKPNNKKKKLGAIILVGFIILGAVALVYYLRYKATHISTDDAFVDGHIHTIASKVKGTIRHIYVMDNQSVKKGDLLIEVDPVDYEVKVNEALSSVNVEKAKLADIEAQVAVAKDRVSEINAGIAAAKANLELEEANLDQAERDSKRAVNLYKSATIPKERYEKTMTAYSVLVAKVRAARDQLKQAEKALETQKSVVKQTEVLKSSQYSRIREKEAQLDTARLNYGYTRIYAPADGYVTKRSAELGNQVQAEQPLLAVVSLGDIWVTANYKETQLQKVKPGQKAVFKVDTYPGTEFKGKIDSIMAGTGSAFSLFPPENATGNYVKVVQRIPVKIVLDRDTDPGHVLRIGMSVVPTILVETK
jgi:membrane fusion protein (multidrug efflux system)